MSEKAFEGKLIDVVVRDGNEIVVHGPAVAIVAVDAQDRVVLVQQERAPVGGRLLELPAGGVEDGEAPRATAERELREETGLYGGEWLEAASFYTTPGYSDERMHLFVATGLEEAESEPSGDEEIELVRAARRGARAARRARGREDDRRNPSAAAAPLGCGAGRNRSVTPAQRRVEHDERAGEDRTRRSPWLLRRAVSFRRS